MDYFQSQRLAAGAGVPVETIEKDYFIELMLLHLAKEENLNIKLVFRGGTALKKIYFSDYRFSEDMDFLVGDKENLEDCRTKLFETIEKVNSEYPYNLDKRFESESDRLQLFVSYDIIQEIRAVKELKVDILKDDHIPPCERRRILFSHREFSHEDAKLITYNLESFVVDKIMRILDVDSEPRDLYDLWHLLKLDLNVERIKEGLRSKLGYETSLPNLLRAVQSEDYRRNWEIRLTRQIKDLPSFMSLTTELKELISEKLIKQPG